MIDASRVCLVLDVTVGEAIALPKKNWPKNLLEKIYQFAHIAHSKCEHEDWEKEFIALEKALIERKEIPRHIPQTEKTIQLLADRVSEFSYNDLELFMKTLSKKLAEDGKKDKKRGRIKLATALKKASKAIKKAWKISASHMVEVKLKCAVFDSIGEPVENV